ncbi:MAG: hypothetical protein LBK65_08720 [Tannerellaceae bacterium]|jgi:hypothetical protein|nr:hypothetical protein [Tannerellaceae bacterium]
MHYKSLSELPDKEFLEYVNSIYDHCLQHSMPWNIDSALINDLHSFLTVAQNAFEANANPSTRNLVTSMEKKRAFADLKHNLSIFINYIESNMLVPDEALAYMHLRPRTQPKHEPVPAPTEAPLVDVKQQNDEVAVYVTRKEFGQPTDGVQIKPYHGFKLHWQFEGETVWRTEISTRLHHTLYFDSQDEDRHVVLSAAWVNPRMEEGPWSKKITVTII